MSADEFVDAVNRYLIPEIDRVVTERLDGAVEAVRREMYAQFDGVYARLDRLDDEYQALRAGVGRLEERMTSLEQRMTSLEQRMTAVEQKLDQFALRSELDELKDRVAEINARIAQLEQQLARA